MDANAMDGLWTYVYVMLPGATASRSLLLICVPGLHFLSRGPPVVQAARPRTASARAERRRDEAKRCAMTLNLGRFLPD